MAVGKVGQGRDLQVLSVPFPLILHKKFRKYIKYSRNFLYRLNEKIVGSKLLRILKSGCWLQDEAKNTGIPDMYSEVLRATDLFKTANPYLAPPKLRPFFSVECGIK